MVKGIVNAYGHMEFCLVLSLITTSICDKWAVIWPPTFATMYVSLLPANKKCMQSTLDVSKLKSSQTSDISKKIFWCRKFTLRCQQFKIKGIEMKIKIVVP